MLGPGLEHELAYHPSLRKQLVRLSRRGKRKALRDQRPDCSPSKQLKEGGQVASKKRGLPALQPLDAVRRHAFPARKKPAADDEQAEDRDCTKAMTTL